MTTTTAGSAMLVTLFTDAGFCPDTRCASYAVWAKANGRTLRHAGVLRGEVPGSEIAELRALANGVALVLSTIKPPAGSRIIAQTDCQVAINAMLGTGFKKAHAQERVRHAVEDIRNRLLAAEVAIEYRHVRGHKGVVTARNAVNTWCDAECTRHLRQARDAVRVAKKKERRAVAATERAKAAKRKEEEHANA